MMKLVTNSTPATNKKQFEASCSTKLNLIQTLSSITKTGIHNLHLLPLNLTLNF